MEWKEERRGRGGITMNNNNNGTMTVTRLRKRNQMEREGGKEEEEGMRRENKRFIWGFPSLFKSEEEKKEEELNSMEEREEIERKEMELKRNERRKEKAEKWRDEWMKKTDSRFNIKWSSMQGFELFAKEEMNEDECIFSEEPLIQSPSNSSFCNHCCLNLSSNHFVLPSGNHILVGNDSSSSFGNQSEEENKLLDKLSGKGKKLKNVREDIILCSKCNVIPFCSKQCLSDGMKVHSLLCGTHLNNQQLDIPSSISNMDNEIYANQWTSLTARMISKLFSEYNEGKLSFTRKETEDKMEFFSLSGGSWDLLDNLNRPPYISEEEDELIDEEFKFFNNLIHRKRPNSVPPFFNYQFYREIRMICMQNSSLLKIQMEWIKPSFDPSQLFKTETQFISHGSFLPGFGSLLNHSCDPNISISPKFNHQLEWISSKKIEKDEQLTISFVNPDLPLDQRREILLEKFGFWCECHLCQQQEQTEESEEDEHQSN
eukprot:TRINITY_DN5731_c0_g1_i2.p1 TRINITY_DN5731_c0_g1~~TRINITY_DN5731_c0_g1_i2.p1  ORF type:complete len:487 (-),score=204.07 TRINITY_DN5731_c0_g1_i2:249-1709(-)